MNKLTHKQKRRVVEAYGFFVGPRDRRFKPAFQGRFMVREGDDEADRADVWCVVGDDLAALVDEAFDLCASFSYFDAVCKDIQNGGDGILHPNGKGAGPRLV